MKVVCGIQAYLRKGDYGAATQLLMVMPRRPSIYAPSSSSKSCFQSLSDFLGFHPRTFCPIVPLTAFSPPQPRSVISQKPPVSSSAISCKGTRRTSFSCGVSLRGRTPAANATSKAVALISVIRARPTVGKRMPCFPVGMYPTPRFGRSRIVFTMVI
jgi:hypothetical protein